ncbi:MAG: DUF4147 domain-containing protein, partial [Deltaproteobacteria bacterium]|nr:DUF4147 domain-containing protein [Deltaproteobacteria bacterium]
VGKAAVPMASALATDLRGMAPGSLVTAVGATCCDPLPPPVRLLDGDHPLPADASARAASAALEALARAEPSTPVLLALSGGASAAWCAPAADLSVADIATATSVLMRHGASIQQLNCVRRHLSAIQGGWLAVRAAPRPLLTLALVDVVGGEPHDIGSGPAVGDPTRHADALAAIDALGAGRELPPPIRRHLELGAAGRRPENPAPDDPILGTVGFFEIGTPALLLDAMLAVAADLDLALEVERALVSCSVESLADRLAAWVRAAPAGKRLALAGETTLTLPARPGRGGRAHHLVLAVAARLHDAARPWALCAVGSDGSDGNSGAAGAAVDREALAHLDRAELEHALTNADSATLLARLGAQIVTGPTGTNLTDVIAIDVG